MTGEQGQTERPDSKIKMRRKTDQFDKEAFAAAQQEAADIDEQTGEFVLTRTQRASLDDVRDMLRKAQAGEGDDEEIEERADFDY